MRTSLIVACIWIAVIGWLVWIGVQGKATAHFWDGSWVLPLAGFAGGFILGVMVAGLSGRGRGR
jgi:hypothetical protein